MSPGGGVRSVDTVGGGGVGGDARIVSSTHAPRSTGDVRSGYDVTISTLPLPNKPKRRESVSSTRRN